MKTTITTLSLICTMLFAQGQTKMSSSTFGNLEARAIGPAVMGGRITSIDAVNNDPRTVYVGTAAGGVWKTTTGGNYFKPIFDKYTQSIGDIKICQQKPNIVWVGTGESNMRNTVSYGTGIYKSTDGGDNWQFMGLDSSEHIAKIAINPNDENTVYVAVPGALWSNSKHRGLYKTIDGGKTWVNILFVDDKTGCADIVMDPANPNVLYASMWQFRRQPWSFSSGGPGSGLYKSEDGGKSWNKIEEGFEKGDKGRICLAVAPTNPDQLYCIVESKNTALYTSNNAGASWKKQSTNDNVTGRPFYFSVLTVDPTDYTRVYRPGFDLAYSVDTGKSFIFTTGAGGGWVHSDHHALWINPNNPYHMFLGTDGGVYMSLDRGVSWFFLNTLPVSQYYHVSYDQQSPYNVYGGLQDNGSWVGPSQSIGGIGNKDWTDVGFGDGFWVHADPNDNNIVYSEYQGGHASRLDRKSNEYRSIQPQKQDGDPKLRFHWNTPLVMSINEPGVVYMASQFLYRSDTRGDEWIKISPDLTTNDPSKQKQDESGGVTVDNSSAENHCTIFTIAEIPGMKGAIWVGTDDGNIQLTLNAGKTWTNMANDLKGVPSHSWVSSIEPSTFDKNTVFVTIENHMRGDFTPYVFKSTNLGKSWTQLPTDKVLGYCHKIKQDIVNPNLLFLGTEMGLFVSIDAGQTWVQFKNNVPNTPIRDITIHPKTNDLILASHGRGVLIIDDITPIRALNAQILDKEIVFLPNRPSYLSLGQFGNSYPNPGGYNGPNVDERAVITYYLKNRITKGELNVEIYDANDVLVETIPGNKRKGINTVYWAMKTKPPRTAQGVRLDGGGFTSTLVNTGTYKVYLVKDGEKIPGQLELLPSPNSSHTVADRALQSQTASKLFKMEEDLAYLNGKILALSDTLDGMKAANANNKKLVAAIDDFNKGIFELRSQMVAVIAGTGITGEEKLRERMTNIYAAVCNYEGKPSNDQLNGIKVLETELMDLEMKTTQFLNNNLPKINNTLTKNSIKTLKVMDRKAFEAVYK